MNDTELDNLLNTWTTPDPPPSLRGRVRAGYATLTHKPRRRFRLSFWMIFGFAALLLILTAALPKTVELVVPAQKIPYTVDTDTTTFMPDGTVHELRMTTYMRNGVEIILARAPGNPLWTSVMNASLLLFSPVDPHQWAEFVASGCSNVRDIQMAIHGVMTPPGRVIGVGTLVGHEAILGYQTTVTKHVSPSGDAGDALKDGRIVTLWQAPDLGCFDLKMVHEQKRSDGTYRLVEERHAVKITVNP